MTKCCNKTILELFFKWCKRKDRK